MGLFRLFDRFHSWSNSLISERFPKLSLYYYKKPGGFFLRLNHPVHRLLSGKSPVVSTKKSVLFFSIHKSATSFMSTYLGEVAREAGLQHIDYNGYFYAQGAASLEKQKQPEMLQKVFHPKGYFYGPLRYFLEIPGIENYTVILFLRDPRDVLTSQYFSIKNTHPLNTERMIERRKAAQQMSIDEHVRAEADRFLERYTIYTDQLLGKKNVLFLKYEDMITGFPSFLEKVNQHFELQLNEAQLKKLDRSDAFRTLEEDFSSHKRKVSAGDYKEKLQPETIAWLNEKFAAVLKKLEY